MVTLAVKRSLSDAVRKRTRYFCTSAWCKIMTIWLEWRSAHSMTTGTPSYWKQDPQNTAPQSVASTRRLLGMVQFDHRNISEPDFGKRLVVLFLCNGLCKNQIANTLFRLETLIRLCLSMFIVLNYLLNNTATETKSLTRSDHSST